jgi:hypothetical protein
MMLEINNKSMCLFLSTLFTLSKKPILNKQLHFPLKLESLNINIEPTNMQCWESSCKKELVPIHRSCCKKGTRSCPRPVEKKESIPVFLYIFYDLSGC